MINDILVDPINFSYSIKLLKLYHLLISINFLTRKTRNYNLFFHQVIIRYHSHLKITIMFNLIFKLQNSKIILYPFLFISEIYQIIFKITIIDYFDEIISVRRSRYI